MTTNTEHLTFNQYAELFANNFGDSIDLEPRDVIISQLKLYMHHIAYNEHNNMFSSFNYENIIEKYYLAAGAMLDLCTKMNIDVSGISVSYCGYEVEVDDLDGLDEIWGIK